MDDFIKNYGSPKKLSSDQIITLEPSGSFVNTGGHDFTLVTKSGTVVSKATYNEQGSSTDTSDNLDHTSVIYKAAPNGDVLMTKAGSKVVATPGFVLNEQSFKPVIKHSVPTKTATPHDLTITADVTSDYSAIQEVKLFYKKEEDKDYTSIPMTKSDGQYSAVIPKKKQ